MNWVQKIVFSMAACVSAFFPSESYDVILMSGGFAPGKILPSAFTELLRVLRPGGYILWTMKDGYGATDPDFALFDVKV